jgi:hypothetical protein
MTTPDFTKVETMERFHSDFLAAASTAKSAADKAALLEKGLTDLNEIVSSLKNAPRIEALTEDQAAVTRAYVVGDSVSDRQRSQVARVARHEGTKSVQGAAPLMGVEGVGVARIYGGEDDTGIYRHGVLDDPNPKSDWQRDAQTLANRVSLLKATGHVGNIRKHTDAFARHMARGPGVIGKMFSDNSNEGAELLPDMTFPLLQRAAQMDRGLAATFAQRTVGNGGTKKNPFLNSNSMQMYVAGARPASDNEPGAYRRSSMSYSERSFDIPTLAGVLVMDMDAEEDAIIQHETVAMEQAGRTWLDTIEDNIINGDTAATHQDAIAAWTAGGRWTASAAAGDHRTAWIGLRARAFDVSNAESRSGSATAKAYVGDVGKLGIAHAFQDVAMCPSTLYYLQQLVIDSDLFTADKSGLSATRFAAQIGSLGGYPVLLSEFNSDELETSGLYTDGSGAKGGRLIFNRSRFELVSRRGLNMNIEPVYRDGVRYLTVTGRTTFRTIDASTVKNVHYGYNL